MKAKEYPFSSDRKMMSTVAVKDGRTVLFSKGALEVILTRSTCYMDNRGDIKPIDAIVRRRLAKTAEDYERQAYRVLAIAFREGEEEEEEEDLCILGVVAMMDLPREEVPGAARSNAPGVLASA